MDKKAFIPVLLILMTSISMAQSRFDGSGTSDDGVDQVSGPPSELTDPGVSEGFYPERVTGEIWATVDNTELETESSDWKLQIWCDHSEAIERAERDDDYYFHGEQCDYGDFYTEDFDVTYMENATPTRIYQDGEKTYFFANVEPSWVVPGKYRVGLYSENSNEVILQEESTFLALNNRLRTPDGDNTLDRDESSFKIVVPIEDRNDDTEGSTTMFQRIWEDDYSDIQDVIEVDLEPSETRSIFADLEDAEFDSFAQSTRFDDPSRYKGGELEVGIIGQPDYRVYTYRPDENLIPESRKFFQYNPPFDLSTTWLSDIVGNSADSLTVPAYHEELRQLAVSEETNQGTYGLIPPMATSEEPANIYLKRQNSADSSKALGWGIYIDGELQRVSIFSTEPGETTTNDIDVNIRSGGEKVCAEGVCYSIPGGEDKTYGIKIGFRYAQGLDSPEPTGREIVEVPIRPGDSRDLIDLLQETPSKPAIDEFIGNEPFPEELPEKLSFEENREEQNQETSENQDSSDSTSGENNQGESTQEEEPGIVGPSNLGTGEIGTYSVEKEKIEQIRPTGFNIVSDGGTDYRDGYTSFGPSTYVYKFKPGETGSYTLAYSGELEDGDTFVNFKEIQVSESGADQSYSQIIEGPEEVEKGKTVSYSLQEDNSLENPEWFVEGNAEITGSGTGSSIELSAAEPGRANLAVIGDSGEAYETEIVTLREGGMRERPQSHLEHEVLEYEDHLEFIEYPESLEPGETGTVVIENQNMRDDSWVSIWGKYTGLGFWEPVTKSSYPTVEEGRIEFEIKQPESMGREDGPMFLEVVSGNYRGNTLTYDTWYTGGPQVRIGSENGEQQPEDSDEGERETGNTGETAEESGVNVDILLENEQIETGTNLRVKVEAGERFAKQGYNIIVENSDGNVVGRSTRTENTKTVLEVDLDSDIQPGTYTAKVEKSGIVERIRKLFTSEDWPSEEFEVIPRNENDVAQATWKNYCTENQYAENLGDTAGLRECLQENIIPSYFVEKSGQNPQIAESVCNDLLNRTYSEEKGICSTGENPQ